MNLVTTHTCTWDNRTAAVTWETQRGNNIQLCAPCYRDWQARAKLAPTVLTPAAVTIHSRHLKEDP